ncbi:ketoacyl-ACP synthase III family protein [Amycolatopsis palatopharyngis]|uniref:ketoacyl-ACP synthase III family protein n=1 Tax=Amycolatopsis palatopharyngis TaxID=187982 RepID=UPI001FE55D9E|nr:ketoacyl-ACP synthase III family protein [Amycolatopsis palatopharyngis]
MLWDDVYLRAAASWLPPAMPAEVAVALGLAEAEAVRRAQVTGVTIAKDSPPEMGVAAAHAALERSGCASGDIALVLHACSYYQGHDMWAPASYIQHHAVGNRSPAIELRQTSNGGMAALELAAAYLTATGGAAALLSTSDRFCAPGIDRWRTDPGTVFADGATALVLARGSGFARLRSLVTVGEPALERMHRGDDPFGDAPLATRVPVDIDETTRAYVRGRAGQRVVALMASRHAESVEYALDEAEVKLGDIDWFVLPHFGRRRLDVNYFRRFGIDRDRTLWSWSRGVGHLGAGDQFAGIAHLLESGRLRPGQRVMLMGVGGGFTWSAAVLEIGCVPDWYPETIAESQGGQVKSSGIPL